MGTGVGQTRVLGTFTETSEKGAILPLGYNAGKMQVWSNGQPSFLTQQKKPFSLREFVVLTQREADKKEIQKMKKNLIILSEFLD